MNSTTKTVRFFPEERETHLWYDPIDHIWTMESNIPKHFNKAVRQGWTPVSKSIYEDGTVCAMTLTASQKAALFSAKNNELDDDFEDE